MFKIEEIKVLDDVKSFSIFSRTHFAIKTDNTLYGWGDNTQGQIGDSTKVDRDSPVKIMENVAAISAIYRLIDVNNTTWAWNRDIPTPEQEYEDIVTVYGNYLLGTNGELYQINRDGTLGAVIENVKLPSVSVANK